MPATPRVTIGLPVYNSQRYLELAFESILAQTYEDFVLVVSDNGSTDDTQAICERFAKQDPRVEYHRYEENRGLAWNFNNVVQLAKTPYFKWQCYDDLMDPRMLAECLAILDREPDTVVAYSNAQLIDDDGVEMGEWSDGVDTRGKTPHERLDHFLYHRNHGQLESQFGVIRLDTLKSTQLMGGIPYSDQVLLAELHLRGEFHEHPDRLFIRRIHVQISTANRDMGDLGVLLDPDRKGKRRLLRLERLLEFVKAVKLAPLSAAEKGLITFEGVEVV